MSVPILHLALQDDWDAAVASGGVYDRSTVGVSLAEEGFIHCSFPDQVVATAGRYYAGRDDVVVLVIDTDRLDAEVRVEDLSGTGVEFPHIYGPITADAVVDVVSVEAAAARR